MQFIYSFGFVGCFQFDLLFGSIVTTFNLSFALEILHLLFIQDRPVNAWIDQ